MTPALLATLGNLITGICVLTLAVLAGLAVRHARDCHRRGKARVRAGRSWATREPRVRRALLMSRKATARAFGPHAFCECGRSMSVEEYVCPYCQTYCNKPPPAWLAPAMERVGLLTSPPSGRQASPDTTP